MSTQIKHRRGSDSDIAAFTPAIGEWIHNTSDNSIHTGDGATVGGNKLLTHKQVPRKFPDLNDFINSTNNTKFDAVEIESYHPIIYPSTAGPKGGHKRHRTGGTNTSPTVGSPVAVSTIGTGTQAGYVWDGDGVEWFLNIKTATPYEFGATGDGVVDDATACNDALLAGVKELIFTDGVFLIGSTASDYIQLTSLNGVEVRGVGGVIKLAASSPVLSSKSSVYLSNCTDCRVTGLILDGNATNNTSNTLSATGLITGVYMDGCTRVVVDGNFVKESNNNGIYATNSSKECVIVNNTLTDNFGSDIRVGITAEAVVANNTIELTKNIHSGVAKQDGFIAVKFGGSAVINGNHMVCRAGVTDVPASLIWAKDIGRVSISNNIGIDKTNTVSYAIQGDMDTSAEWLSITGNQFETAQGVLVSGAVAALTLDELIINDNLIKSATNAAVNITATNITVGKISIQSNMLESAGYGVYCDNGEATIAGNTIVSTGSGHGILAAGSNCIITDNKIDMNGATTRGVECYSIDSIVSGNRIYNYTGVAIKEVSPADWNLIHANHTKGGTITVIGANTVSTDNI